MNSNECFFFMAMDGLCRHSTVQPIDSLHALRLRERQTEIQRRHHFVVSAVKSKQTDFTLTNDSYKVPHKTQRMCAAATTVSSNLFTRFRTLYNLTHALKMHIGPLLISGTSLFFFDRSLLFPLYSDSW